MKVLDLTALSVEEMPEVEVREVEGGISSGEIVAILFFSSLEPWAVPLQAY